MLVLEYDVCINTLINFWTNNTF